MVIVSIVKQVPAPEARFRLVEGAPDFEGVTLVLDGMDELGVEQALQVRERMADGGSGVDLVAVGFGAVGSDHVVRTALAMGFDRGIHLESSGWVDPLAVAPHLADVIREVGADIVFVGGKHADWDSSALGPAVAESLAWPHVDWTTEFGVDGTRFEAVHDVDDGREAIRGNVPVVVTTQQTLNEPRYPTLPNIINARSKPLDLRRVGTEASYLRTRAQLPLARDRRRVVLEGDAREVASEVVRRLRKEAKVL